MRPDLPLSAAYKILGLPAGAPLEEVEAAHRLLWLKCAPGQDQLLRVWQAGSLDALETEFRIRTQRVAVQRRLDEALRAIREHCGAVKPDRPNPRRFINAGRWACPPIAQPASTVPREHTPVQKPVRPADVQVRKPEEAQAGSTVQIMAPGHDAEGGRLPAIPPDESRSVAGAAPVKPARHVWTKGLGVLAVAGLVTGLVINHNQNGGASVAESGTRDGGPQPTAPMATPQKSADTTGPATSPLPSNCLASSPAVVSLTGKLVAKTSAADTTTVDGSPETYWFLSLPAAICASIPDGPSRTDVWNVQLLFSSAEMYKSYSSFLDREAKVTGALLQAASRQHHTDVLLEVRNIEEPTP